MQPTNTMPKREKNDVAVKLWLPESLYRDLQDLAAEQEQSLSEHIRRALEVCAYGTFHKLSLRRERQDGRRAQGR